MVMAFDFYAGSSWCIGVSEEKRLDFQCCGIKEVCPG